MKILFFVHQFYPEYYTGTERFVLNVATMMQRSGHQVKVITYSFYDDSLYDKTSGNLSFREFTHVGIPVLAFKYRRQPDDIHLALENAELRAMAAEIIAREKADLVHVAHTMRTGEFVTVLPALGIPYLITLTDFFLICPKYTLYTSRNTLCNGPEGGRACAVNCPELDNNFIIGRLRKAREFLFGAKAVIAPSLFLRDMIKREFSDLPILNIGYGIRYSTIKKNTRTYSKGDQIAFCYAGSINHHKGVHILIDAFKKLAAPNCTLDVYGSGADQKYVDGAVASAQGDQRIRFRGVFSGEKVGEILATIDVVIVPSIWYENTPIVLREATACNVPAISSDAGGMTENIVDGRNGFVFEMGNSEHLRKVLQQIADDPPILNGIKAELMNTMIPTVEQEAYAYSRIYSGMLEHRATGRTASE